MDYYVTNDCEGATFDRYYLDVLDEPIYFGTLWEACNYISELTGIVVSTENEIYRAIETYHQSHEDLDWINFHIFEVIDD